MATTTNRYLTGAFAPVSDEVTATDLAVEGTIPPALDGLYVRNGPNPVIPPDPDAYHWFLGDGMLHGIDLAGGRARWYKNRYVRTERAARALGEEPPSNQPPDTLLGEMNGSVANTNIVAHAGRLLALVEVALPTAVDGSLSTLGRHDFSGRLRSSMTAHPHTDPATGELCFFGYEVVGPPYLRYHVADRDGALVHSTEIDLPAPTMMHDFAITESRAVFLDLPVVFDLDLLATRPFPAAWKPSNGARVGLLGRREEGDRTIWCEVEPCYVFHVLNAYDDGEEVVLDCCVYASMFDLDIHGVDGGPARLERWRISPTRRSVSREVICDLPLEFPRPDERRFARPHGVGFFASPRMTDESIASAEGMSIARVDLHTGAVTGHDFGAGRLAGEAVFVPESPEASEGEGYLVTIVADLDGASPSDLVVLDATDLAAAPVATVHLPVRVPLGFHGNFVPRDELGG